MKKYQILLTFLLIIGYLLVAYLEYESYRDSKESKLSDANLSVINIKEKISINSNNLYDSNFKLWDLEINKILQDREKKEHELTLQQLKNSRFNTNGNSLKEEFISNIDLTRRKICLDKKCWKFMGLLTIGNKREVTLLSVEEKPKLETLSVGDALLEELIISEIRGDRMIVVHKKDKRKFTLKLFDVDASEYLPKEKVTNE